MHWLFNQALVSGGVFGGGEDGLVWIGFGGYVCSVVECVY